MDDAIGKIKLPSPLIGQKIIETLKQYAENNVDLSYTENMRSDSSGKSYYFPSLSYRQKNDREIIVIATPVSPTSFDTGYIDPGALYKIVSFVDLSVPIFSDKKVGQEANAKVQEVRSNLEKILLAIP